MRLLSRAIFREVATASFFGAFLFTFVLFLRQVGHLFEILVRSSAPIHDPAWMADPIDLEDLVLAYMGKAAAAEDRPALE